MGAGETSEHLDSTQQRQAASHASPQAIVIHEVVREEGEAEIRRSTGALFWSGTAGGLSMGFSLLTLAPAAFNVASRALDGNGCCPGAIVLVSSLSSSDANNCLPKAR